MIDLGLTKLAVIGAVALIVLGPEKLPKVARLAGSLLGRAQRYLNEVKAEVSREIELEELRKAQKDMEQAAAEFKSEVVAEIDQVEQSVNSIWSGETVQHPAAVIQTARKVREFRRKKLARSSALPAWYKHQQGGKSRLLSASARVARYRPTPVNKQSFY
jgi:sec-independent protein translocase protein TatB